RDVGRAVRLVRIECRRRADVRRARNGVARADADRPYLPRVREHHLRRTQVRPQRGLRRRRVFAPAAREDGWRRGGGLLELVDPAEEVLVSGGIEPGTRLPDWDVPAVDAGRMKTTAALLRDPTPIHWDPAVLRELGMGERPINQGPLNMAYVMNMLAA